MHFRRQSGQGIRRRRAEVRPASGHVLHQFLRQPAFHIGRNTRRGWRQSLASPGTNCFWRDFPPIPPLDKGSGHGRMPPGCAFNRVDADAGIDPGGVGSDHADPAERSVFCQSAAPAGTEGNRTPDGPAADRGRRPDVPLRPASAFSGSVKHPVKRLPRHSTARPSQTAGFDEKLDLRPTHPYLWPYENHDRFTRRDLRSNQDSGCPPPHHHQEFGH